MTAIVSMTSPVTRAPTPLTLARHHQPSVRRRSQWRTMLDCDSVNEMKTPTA